MVPFCWASFCAHNSSCRIVFEYFDTIWIGVKDVSWFVPSPQNSLLQRSPGIGHHIKQIILESITKKDLDTHLGMFLTRYFHITATFWIICRSKRSIRSKKGRKPALQMRSKKRSKFVFNASPVRLWCVSGASPERLQCVIKRS